MKVTAKLLLLLVAMVLVVGCKLSKKDSGETSAPAGETPAATEAPGVAVSGDIPDQNSVEFVEAENSVQISGVNLTAPEKKITVESVTVNSAGTVVITAVQTISTTEKTFRISGLPFETYMLIKIDDKPMSVLQPVNTPGNGATNVALFAPTDATAIVTSKLFNLAVTEKETAQTASSLVAEGLLNIPGLAVTAGSIISGFKVKKSGGGTTGTLAALDLTEVMTKFVEASNEDRNKLSPADRKDYANTISQVAAGTLNRDRTRMTDSYAAAHIANLELKRQTKEIATRSGLDAQDPAEETIREIAKSSPEVFIGYSNSQEVYAKYAVEITNSGVPPAGAQSEYQSSITEDYSDYTNNPQSYQDYMNSYTPPDLPDSLPPVPPDSGSYTAGPSPEPTPSPDYSPEPENSPEPESTPGPGGGGGPSPSPTPTPDGGSTPEPPPIIEEPPT